MSEQPSNYVSRSTSESLWRDEARLADALEIAGGVGTWDWDLKTDRIYANERFATLFGVDPVVARTTGAPSAEYMAAIHPEDQHIVVNGTQKALATVGPYVVEFRLPQKDGEDLWIYALGHVYADADGNLSRFPGAAMDITQRKQTEMELQAARDRATAILESIPDGFFTLDRNYCFVYVNKVAEKILGARREDLIGKSVWEVYPGTGDSELPARYARVIGEKVVLEFQWFFKEWDRWFALKASPTNEGGLSVYFRDITIERAREHELVGANRELEEFAYVASHDLQEPLRAVKIYTQLLMMGVAGNDPPSRSYGTLIEDAATRMDTLIRDLLTFSRAAQRDEQPVGTADLSVSVAEANAVLQTAIIESGATIKVGTLPVVHGDTKQLAYVFQNLLSNALKYRKADIPLVVNVLAERHERHWVVSVNDNGLGFEQRFAERIFGLFKRLHGREYPGTGLGLAICQRVIERYGGRIWATSTPGQGSTFFFELPEAGAE